MNILNFYKGRILQKDDFLALQNNIQDFFGSMIKEVLGIGIATGLNVGVNSPTDGKITVSLGTSYSASGNRIRLSAPVEIDLATVLSGQDDGTYYVSLFSKALYQESQQNTDFDGNIVNFIKTETGEIISLFNTVDFPVPVLEDEPYTNNLVDLTVSLVSGVAEVTAVSFSRRKDTSPEFRISEVFEVSTYEERDALIAQTGDIAVVNRTVLGEIVSETYMKKTDGSWILLPNSNADTVDGYHATDLLSSANGFTTTAISNLSTALTTGTLTPKYSEYANNSYTKAEMDLMILWSKSVNGNIYTNTKKVGIGIIEPLYDLDIHSDMNLAKTEHAGELGIILKGGERFFHDFNYGDNGTVTTEGRNLFLGIDAGNLTAGETATSTIEASDNIGIGNKALAGLTIGYSNAFIGNLAGENITQGAYNTALGQKACWGVPLGVDEAIGMFNTAIGAYALENLSSGTRNTAIGAYAGSNPVLMGYGFSGSNNTLIGYQANPQLSTDDNTIVIGYLAVGLGSNTTVIGNESTTLTRLRGELILDGNIRPLSVDKVDAISISSFDGTKIFSVDTLNRRIGIGTSTPTYKLTVSNSGANSIIYANSFTNDQISTGFLLLRKSRGTSVDSLSQTLQGDRHGAIAFGGVNSSNAWIESASIQVYQTDAPGASYLKGDLIYYTSDGVTQATERMRLTGTGNVGIGISPSYQLHLSTDNAAKLTTNTWIVTSDERMKKDIELADLDICYNTIKNIPLKRFGWKYYDETQAPDQNILGWIAQDVQKIFPKAVMECELEIQKEIKDEDGNIIQERQILEDGLTLNSDQILKALYGAVQKLQNIVELQANEINELKGRTAILEELVKRMQN